jgi:hypothetical protein
MDRFLNLRDTDAERAIPLLSWQDRHFQLKERAVTQL